MKKFWRHTLDSLNQTPWRHHQPQTLTIYILLSVTDNSASSDTAQHAVPARERMSLFLRYCVTYLWKKIRARRYDIGICRAHIEELNKIKKSFNEAQFEIKNAPA